MSCCGQQRDAIRETESAAYPSMGVSRSNGHRHETAVAQAAPASATPLRGAVTIRCRERSAMTVDGPVTGRRYQFAGRGSMQAVDKRDVETLLATGMFDRAWG